MRAAEEKTAALEARASSASEQERELEEQRATDVAALDELQRAQSDLESRLATAEQERDAASELAAERERAHADAVSEVAVWQGKAEMQGEQLEQAQAARSATSADLDAAREELHNFRPAC